MSEKCRICQADETGDRTVMRSENIPLCNRHWSQWVGRYAWPSESEPPCSAHLILESGEWECQGSVDTETADCGGVV